jgi:hypothetical protein
MNAGQKLHVGCGNKRLEGWVNVDVEALPNVDVVADVRSGLEFRDVELVFAEHFLEHLRIDEAMSFFGQVHQALREGGWFRLSTPNLDWVWDVMRPRELTPSEELDRGLYLNRSFYGWGHRFLWTGPLLREALGAIGFEPVRACAYGESQIPELRGLERHETYPDKPELPHVLIFEAAKGRRDDDRLRRFEKLVNERFLEHREEWELQFLRRRITELEEHVDWMKESRFWKLRERWWRLRERWGG